MNSSLSPERRSEILFTNIGDSDCGVIALQAVAGISRKKAERVLRKHGWDEFGTPRGGLEAAAVELGFKVKQRPVIRETPATFSAAHEYGSFFIYVTTKTLKGEYGGHVMALVNGDLHNSKGSWRIPCEQITEVTTR